MDKLRSEAHAPVTLAPALAAALADCFTRLARARSDEQLFEAAVACFEPMEPWGANLMVTTAFDADERPTHVRTIGHWVAGVGVAELPPSRRDTDVREIRISRLWWGQSDPLFFEDIAADPRADQFLRDTMARNGVKAQVMLPLHSDVVGRVIGVLLIHWRSERPFTVEERYVLGLLAVGLGSFLASRRLLAAQEEALRTAERQRRTLRAVLDNLPVGVYLADASTGQALLANQLGLQMLGHRGAAVSDAPATETYTVLHPGTDVPVPVAELPLVQTLRSGEPRTGVVDVLRPHDHVRLTLELSAVPVRDEEGSMFAAVVVYVDVTERNRVEAERARIREELIRSQAQALAERSTPLLPLSDSVVAMAIVGSLDSGRADQILETLLTGCAARRARFAILDITGVPHADAAIAGTLLRAAAAVRLLGVEPVLTGIRPDVANALVSLDLDLRGLVTLSTLQDGIAYAIGRARGAGRGRERGA